MKANKILVSLLTLVLTLALMFSLFSVSVFAEDASSSTTGSSSSTTADDHDDHDGHDHGSSDKKEETNIVETIISLSIVGVVLIAVAIYCIVNREKVGKFFRALKSEMKKIVWFSWKDTRKSSIVVIVAVVIIALVIGVLDFAFNNGIKLLYNLFN